MMPGDGGSGDLSTTSDDLAVGPDIALPPDLGPTVLTVDGLTNALTLAACQVTPATLPGVPAGTYTISLDASTLSKGVSPTVGTFADNYVLVELPLAAGDAQQAHRFFMLNGIGATATFTLGATGTINVMFVDSDHDANTGQATVTVTPGPYQTTVDAVTNVLAWGPQGCSSTPATAPIAQRMHDLTMLTSTLMLPASGGAADYVIMRVPSEINQDDFRYVMLNGVNAMRTINSTDGSSLRAWFISDAAGAGGQATVSITSP